MRSQFSVLMFACFAFAHYSDEALYWNLRNDEHVTEKTELNLNNSYFLSLRNYQVNAQSASEIDYPWIARVLHSQQYFKPQLCTAVCIDRQIFITAARCVILLKLSQTSLLYQDHRLKPKAFVLPSVESKQMYEDIGFIVVHDEFDGMWKTVELFDQRRTDEAYEWFGNISFDEFEHKVVGYAKFKSDEFNQIWKTPYYLTQLSVHVSLNLCREILIYNQGLDGFAVPCYHSCTLEQFGKQTELRQAKCTNYHGSLGSAIVNVNTKKLLGIATWGAYFYKHELPVGFSIPNSVSFHEDRSCAETIRDNGDFIVDPGFYQDICDDKRRRNVKPY